ncbi:hypothetical protein COCON_G00192670 [Conger conger]|uniref:Uncharacterized protein n=1 Tax=Conger conger TaxID=82655 RepID=A0A9Q1D410_CONCO|nr:hypothetical protein COCON_G00192670 [Conger conger]
MKIWYNRELERQRGARSAAGWLSERRAARAASCRRRSAALLPDAEEERGDAEETAGGAGRRRHALSLCQRTPVATDSSNRSGLQ